MIQIQQPVVEFTGAGAYASERKVYPRDVSGPLRRLRMAAVIGLLGAFYLFPWARWNGRQAVLFDLPARKFHLFNLTFWPQDFLFLALLLIIAALTLFFLPRWQVACGAATRVHRPCGPRPSCSWNAGLKATACSA